MQSFNYHAHTKRCGHAIGEDEEYVIEAIRNGYQRIGVSDHMPMQRISNFVLAWSSSIIRILKNICGI